MRSEEYSIPIVSKPLGEEGGGGKVGVSIVQLKLYAMHPKFSNAICFLRPLFRPKVRTACLSNGTSFMDLYSIASTRHHLIWV